MLLVEQYACHHSHHLFQHFHQAVSRTFFSFVGTRSPPKLPGCSWLPLARPLAPDVHSLNVSRLSLLCRMFWLPKVHFSPSTRVDPFLFCSLSRTPTTAPITGSGIAVRAYHEPSFSFVGLHQSCLAAPGCPWLCHLVFRGIHLVFLNCLFPVGCFGCPCFCISPSTRVNPFLFCSLNRTPTTLSTTASCIPARAYHQPLAGQ